MSASLFNYPDEDAFLAEAATFARSAYLERLARRIDATDRLPKDLLASLSKRRLLAFSALDDSGAKLLPKRARELVMTAIRELARTSASVAKLVLDQNFGQVQMVGEFGREHAADFIRRIQEGRAQAAFLMTEPQTGSRLSQFTCIATEVAGGFVLDGAKDWISGAEERSLYVVVARAEAPTDHFGLFLVDRGRKGFDPRAVLVGERKEHLGLRGIGEYLVRFRRAFVPAEHVLLAPDSATIGKVMRHYALKRCGQAVIATALAAAALEAAYQYLRKRHPGISGGLAFPTAEFRCAELYAAIQADEQLWQWAMKRILDSADDGVVACSVAKLVATESAVEITNAAVQLCGAVGTSARLPLERFLRDARMLTIVGGTSEVQRATIARYLASS